MSMFLSDPELSFEKVSGIELEEDTNQWPRQVLSELYRTLPAVADYLPSVKFTTIDEEQGMALGIVELTNTTSAAVETQPVTDAVPARALVPVIVKGHKLLPLDILLTAGGRFLPLNETRLREAMFRPSTFELATPDKNDHSLWAMFHPPGRSDNSYGSGMSFASQGGAQYISGPGMKFAMLDRIAASILEVDAAALASDLEAVPGLLKAAADNPVLTAALRKIAEAQLLSTKTASDYKDTVKALYPAQVLQLGYEPRTDQYWAKVANRELGNVDTHHMGRGAFLKFAGADLTNRVDTEGTITVSKPVVVVADADGYPPKIITSTGRCTVYEAGSGKEHSGWVFTDLMDGSGTRVPLAVFVGATLRAFQDQIVGGASNGVDVGSEIPNEPPKGLGCFYFGASAHSTVATVPLHVRGYVADTKAAREGYYDCLDLTGTPVRVRLSTGTRGVIAVPGKNELILPHTAGFFSLPNNAPALVAQGAPSAEMERATEKKAARLVYRGNDTFGLMIEPGTLAKHAGAELDQDTAMFALCLGGLGAAEASQLLTQAEKRGSISLHLQELGGLDLSAQKLAAEKRSSEARALRCNLIKEAAKLQDAMTVDSVLSLGFINAENVKTYVAQIPHLEKALSMLCQLVVAARLGLSEVPESACGRAARGMDDTLQGLKALALREISDVS